MCDYRSSTQLNDWIFSFEDLEECRKRANQMARKYLANSEEKSSPLPFFRFACGFSKKKEAGENTSPVDEGISATSNQGQPFLEPEEEELLVAFYVAKIPSLLGPYAQNQYLRRDIKATATAALLFRRFFLSNSVMIHDPKHMLVAAAFMATKVEDCQTQVHHLEEGTKLMNASVCQSDILKAEYILLGGINCDLLCFHPYKAVLAFTEDLRTFLKGDKGRELASFSNGEDRPIIGQDLSPMHSSARSLVDDVMVSDIPFLYSPGQIGLAALMVSNEQINKPDVPKIDLLGYIENRFEGKDKAHVKDRVTKLSKILMELKEGKFGCGNHQVDLQKLKIVHKKLKKCRGVGKKKKKRKTDSNGPDVKKSRTD
mmetsp:Transcript_4739/g.6859  ORF Transcript_4739/g.6859 Transcript_4739/m.6859 type:complete len:371 (+) Transcript_4739:32-1144(+)|eukprot:CAMPEP_0194237892 /NCGR_PEP_ID=MMETSP0158-20130606/4771_1 /TAXON_ID=33649 /ORGANISM="Thalassionema nitzschioides, Strain L26-B" /LENGTH=370 /DNA_ID=CAMNT_0038972025 /DNA_START=32 /DNA_END=1144 /DNA_ORIENTATION=-